MLSLPPSLPSTLTHPHTHSHTQTQTPSSLQSYPIEPPTTENTKHQKMQTKFLALVFLTASSVFGQNSQPNLGYLLPLSAPCPR